MLGVLIKKEFKQLGFSLTRNNRTKKGLGKGMILGLIALLLYCLGVFGFMFYTLAAQLAAAMVPAGFGWLMFAIMGMFATILGLVGSVMTTYNTLFTAKDNELLLSMPIPPGYILLSRMISCYIPTLAFEALALIPTYIAYAVYGELSAGMIIIGVIMLVVHPLLALALACLLSWLISVLVRRLPGNSKNFVTVVFTLVFIIAYYIVYTRAMQYITMIIENADSVSAFFRTYMIPFMLQGHGCMCDVIQLAEFILLVGLLFGLVYYALSTSFIKVVTTRVGYKRLNYKEKALKSATSGAALLRVEIGRLKGSSAYLLNGALGTLLMPLLAIFIFAKRSSAIEVIDSIAGDSLDVAGFALIAAIGVSFMLTMNSLTAAAISIEGKTHWIGCTMPVSTIDILKAKLKLQYLLTFPPAALVIIALGIILRLTPLYWILLIVFTVVAECWLAMLGLNSNLKHAKLNWVNETAAVKNNMSSLVAIFGGWGFFFGMMILYIALPTIMSDTAFFIVCIVLTTGLMILEERKLRTKGVMRYENL